MTSVVRPENSEQPANGLVEGRAYNAIATCVSGVGVTNAKPTQLLERLLELAIADGQPEAIVEQALNDVIEACRAQVAYVELRDRDGTVRFVRGAGRDQASVETLRATTSSTIAAQVLASGMSVRTHAVGDPRFTDLDSVRRNAIAAVACAPISSPPIGVVYMQRSDEPAAFDDDELRLIELFAKVVAKSAIPQLASVRPLSADVEQVEARRIRATLERRRGDKSATADELGIDRATLYRKLKKLGID